MQQSPANTALGLALFEAQKKLNEEKKVEVQPEIKSVAHRVFDYLTDEGVAVEVGDIAKALGIEKQQASTAVFQLKKVGYVVAHNDPNGGYMTYEAVPDVKYGTLRGSANKIRLVKREVSQVVTPPKIMQALPAPVGLKLTLQTSEGPIVLSVQQAKEVYKELCPLFGDVRIGFDD